MATVWELTSSLPVDEIGTTEMLLSNGWEPFGLDNGRLWFRRLQAFSQREQLIEGDKQHDGNLAYLAVPKYPEQGDDTPELDSEGRRKKPLKRVNGEDEEAS